MKKRILAVLLAATMVSTLLAGCGSKAPATDAPAAEEPAAEEPAAEEPAAEEPAVEASGEEVNLTIWHIENDEVRRKIVDSAIERYEAANPNVKIEQVVMENDPYKTSLATAMAAGQEPDIFVTWGGGWLQEFVDEGKVLDIDDKVKEIEDNYYESALSLFRLEGKSYGMPIRIGPAPIWYNKAIYEELGLEVPKTLAELEANCEAIKAAGLLPFALGNSSQWPGALSFIWFSLREGGSKAFMDAYYRNPGGTFEDPSFIAAGQHIQDWVGKGYYPEGANGINYDTGGSRMLFYSGQAAHIVQTSAFASNCLSESPESFETLGLFNFPLIEGKPGDEAEILGGGNGYSISKSCANPDVAFDLILGLTDLEYGQEIADKSGLLTGIKGLNITNPLTKEMESMVLNATYIQNFYDQFLPSELGNLHKQTTYDMFGGTTTPEEAAKAMEELAVKELGPAQ